MGGKTYENTPETPAVIPPPAMPEEEKVDVKLDVYVADLIQKISTQYAEVQDKLTEETLDLIMLKLTDVDKILAAAVAAKKGKEN